MLTYSRNDTRRGKGNRARVLCVGNAAAAPIGVLATDGVALEPKNVPLRNRFRPLIWFYTVPLNQKAFPV